jgi:acetyl-coA carboxylase, biotin carboxyl carrier protein
MKENDIRKYAELMKELELTGLEITENNQVVRLERSPAAKLPQTPGSSFLPGAARASAENDNGINLSEKGEADSFLSVKSPLVGVFYAAPAENAEPYVSVGESVKKGQVLCIIEAMKLMNEITAEEDGVILEITAANGQIVEYGSELFRMRKQG